MRSIVVIVGVLINLILISCISVQPTQHPIEVSNTTTSHYSVININSSKVDPVFNSVVMLNRDVILTLDGDKNVATTLATGFIIRNVKTKKGKYNSIGLSVKHFCRDRNNKLKVFKQLDRKETKLYKGKVLYISDDVDLCVFKIYNTNANFTPLKLAEELPYMGEKLFIIGAPLGTFPAKVDGYMIRILNDDNEMIETTLPVTNGNSGSPVYNSHFEVVGVLIGVHKRFPHISATLHVSAIKKHLQETNYLRK
ncbi:hypothetical protein CMI47_12800 [Candidatus Pacearchaeota archaeon]|nr:hypothetical protein [Candidatus Pacearchaeota archaeon]|tara:strand:+ start:54218 stop:54976 length:759 start_codon:yes stop_codon:yes gene_type:complete